MKYMQILVQSLDQYRAGLVGADGPTHAGSFDIAYLANIPKMVLMAAADESELKRMVLTAANINDRPSAFRYPRGGGIGIASTNKTEPLAIGKSWVSRNTSQRTLSSSSMSKFRRCCFTY